MNYLITGAAGFIGSAVARNLIYNGHSCVTIDNLSTGRVENVPDGCRFIKGDVFDPHILTSIENYKFDAIIHLAGQSSGEISFDDPVYDLQTNTQSTIMLLRFAVRTGCRKFIYASSMSVYGNQENPRCSETSVTVPVSFYAVGKLASENYMRIFSEYGISCTALRFFNVYGPGQNLDNLRQGMVSIFMAMAIRNRCINVKGSKERFRDFVYIDDVVEAVIKSLSYTGKYDVFNVCTGKATKVSELIEEINKNIDGEVVVEYEGGTPGDQFGIFGSSELIKEKLDWVPKVNLSEGVARMASWAKKEVEI